MICLAKIELCKRTAFAEQNVVYRKMGDYISQTLKNVKFVY